MGLEWESGGLPDEILDKHMLYSSALREDLLHVTLHDENLCNIVAIVKCGFSAVHNMINLACPILKTQVPDTTLLSFKEGTCITRHVKQITVSTDILETPMAQKGQKAIPQIQLDQLQFIASNLLSFETGEDDNIARICSSTAQIPDSFDFANVSELEIREDAFKTWTFLFR